MFDDRLGALGRRLEESHGFIHENKNMCRVTASKDRYPRVKAPLYLVTHMYPAVKVRKSVERLLKLAVRPQKFATHKKTHGFEYKMIIGV